MFFNPISWWRNRRRFVILDPRDNSITFSRALFRIISKAYANDNNPPKVFVFHTPVTGCYGFTINPDLDQPTQLANIQYNSRYKCVGFESLNPAVTRILYDYGVRNVNVPCRCSVSVISSPHNLLYFQIENPSLKQ